MPGPPYPGLGVSARPVGFDDEEKTAVEPGGSDSFDEARTVADSPENKKITRPQDVPASPGVEGETVDEITREDENTGLPDASVLVTQGPNKGERFKLNKIVVTIGRALSNDIVLTDTSVSRRHLKIEFDGLNFHLQDLESGNGTVVNGRDADERFKLTHRDALELGRTLLAFDCPAARARSVVSPLLANPAPKPRTKPAGKPVPRHQIFDQAEEQPTLSLRGEERQHPAFDDVDEEASTISGQRPPGPSELPMQQGEPLRSAAGKSGKGHPLQRPEDLVMPRSPPGGPQPRRTVASHSVPAPVATPRPSPVRRAPSIPPPLPPGASALAERHPPHFDDDDEEGLTRPARPSGPPQPRPGPAPPMAAPGSRGPGPPNAGGARVVYPAAPSQFVRPSPPNALNPRPVNHMGVVQPGPRSSGARWGVIAAAVVVAAIGGVVLAAVLGDDGDGTDTAPVAAAGLDAGPTVETTPDAAVTALANAADGAPAPAPDAAVANASPDAGDGTTLASTAPVVRGSLTTGAELPPSTWGTDEGVLATVPEVKPLETDETDETDEADETDETDAKKKAREDKRRRDRKRRRDKERRDKKRRDDKTDDREDDRQRLARLRRRINAAYRDRNFKSAASAASAASRLARGRDARRLRSAARNYKKLGRYLTQARKTSSSNPRVALSSYIRARAVDRRVGGRHRRFIRNQLLIVAPKAARKAMAADDLVGAKRAVDAARSAGDRVQTSGVLRSLENKARSLIARAKRAQRSGEPAAAQSALNQARRILPASSKLNRQVKELLSNIN